MPLLAQLNATHPVKKVARFRHYLEKCDPLSLHARCAYSLTVCLFAGRAFSCRLRCSRSFCSHCWQPDVAQVFFFIFRQQDELLIGLELRIDLLSQFASFLQLVICGVRRRVTIEFVKIRLRTLCLYSFTLPPIPLESRSSMATPQVLAAWSARS